MSELHRIPESVKLMQEQENLPQTPEKDFELDLTVERLKRHLDVANLIDDLEGDEPLGDKAKKVASIIEGRGWNALFKKLEGGKKDIVVFAVPSGPYAIKNLNDSIFGPQVADDIIEYAKELQRLLMQSYGFEPFKQDYKSGIFEGNGATARFLDQNVASMVQAKLDVYVQQKVEAIRAKKLADGETVEYLDEFAEAVKGGYKISYCINKVTTGTYEDVERAVLQGIQGAKYSQFIDRSPGHYGTKYDADDIVAESERTKTIRNFILDNYNNSLVDSTGTTHRVFEEPNNDGQFQLNRYILRALRKGKLKPKSERDEKVMQLLDEYKQIINLLDAVKPFTHDEVVGEATTGASVRTQLEEELMVAKNITTVDAMKNKVDQKAWRAKAAAILKRDQKDSNCTSPAVFHRTAIETLPDCTYISIDVLDVGVDLLLEYEQLHMSIEQVSPQDKVKRLKEVMVRAGDKKTLELRAIRANVKRYCEEKFGKTIPMLVGGDEITLALPSNVVDEDFLFGLRTASGSRVVTSEVEREQVSTKRGEKKKTIYDLHADAIREGEDAIGVAKKIEELIVVRDHIGVPNGVDGPSATDPALTELIKELKESFVVKKEHKLYYLVLKGEVLPLTVEHDRISVTKDGNKMFIYGAALVLLLAFFAFK